MEKENNRSKNHVDQVRFQPLGDRVLLKRMDTESKEGGILLPDSAKKKPETARVIAVGSGKRDKDGSLIPMPVSVGDMVLIGKYSGQEVTIENEELVIVSSGDLLAKVES
ncbi:co-chaperone GroES [Candidatus Similichlamydia epinepheli]|uniref:co-chaperone GroES n=1 Tax=Candidatus Similichlamydia epinepheli TaxID=1903953 RepID=UPI000D391585|nr:co-chaperone GroES [Candidatus Similichlamydia epinepheli]